MSVSKRKRLSYPATNLGHNEPKRYSGDHNVSVLTQSSHVTHRPAFIKDDVIERFDVTLNGDLQNDTSDELSCVEEDFINSSKLPQKVGKGRKSKFTHSVTKSKSNDFKPSKGFSNIKDFASPDSKKKKSLGWIELHDWIIKPLPDLRGVCVEGQKRGMSEYWHSSAISEAKNKKFVRTASGSLYRLRGKLNKLATLDNGFSKVVAKAFIDGFPSNWKDILNDFYAGLENSICITEECDDRPKPKKSITIKKKTAAASRKVVNNLEDLEAVITPVGLLKRTDSVHNFTTTRSGRLSLPPLAQWQGQRYIISSTSNTLSVGFQTTVAEKASLKQTNEIINRLPGKKGKEWRSKAQGKFVDTNITLPASFKMDQQPALLTNQMEITANNKENKFALNKTLPCPKINIENDTDTFVLNEVKSDLNPRRTLRITLHHCQADSTKSIPHRRKNSSTETKKSNTSVLEHFNKSNLKSSVKHSLKDNQLVNDTVDLLSPSSGDLDCSMVLRSRKIAKSDDNNKVPDFTEGQEISFKVSKSNKKSCVQNYKEVSQESDVGVQQTTKCANRKPRVKRVSSRKASKNINKQISLEKSSNRRGRKRKVEETTLSGDDTGYCTEEPSCMREAQVVTTPKSCGRKMERKRRKLSLSAGDTVTNLDEAWTDSEKRLFERALRTVDANSLAFWCQVSDIVNSRTEEECREFHTVYLDRKTKKPAAKPKKLARKSSGRQKGDPVLGFKGTMKRKANMRDFLKEQNEDYEDNLFDGTPFRSRQLAVPALNGIDFDKDDSEIFGSNHNFITPLTKGMKAGTPGTRLRAELASARKTPAKPANRSFCFGDTPNSAVRKMADKHIYAYMNHQKKNAHDSGIANQTQTQEATLKKPSPLAAPFSSLFSPSITVYDKKGQLEEDEDNDDDDDDNRFVYYWDDN